MSAPDTFKKPLKGKAFIRDRFKRSPESGSYIIPNVVSSWGLLDFYREARSSGFMVEPYSMPEYGVIGFIAVEAGHDPGRASGPITYELYFVGTPTYGKKLDPDDEEVKVEDWQEVLSEHSGHEGMIVEPDVKGKKSFRMICYCKASEGKSIVRRVRGYDSEVVDRTTSAIADILMNQEGE